MIRFANPWLLTLLAAVPVLFWRRRLPALSYGSLPLLDVPGSKNWRTRLVGITPALRAGWLTLLVVALARPQTPVVSTAQHESGLSVMFVIDVSGSMAAAEQQVKGRTLSRLGAVQRFVADVLRPNGLLTSSDAAGAIVFSRKPRIVSPLTTEHRALAHILDSQQVDVLENRTNIGDALALALHELGRAGVGRRFVVLCSDGAHNVENAMPPAEAGRIAQARGIPIVCVGVGIESSTSGPDEETLRALAQMTSGSFHRAARAEDFDPVAADLRARVADEELVFTQWTDAFGVVLVAAVGLFLLESLLCLMSSVRPE